MSPKSPDAIDLLVGRNIRVQRIARDMSQTELAGRLGVSFQQVQKYEQGMNRVGAGRLVRIADALEVPVMTLLHGVPGGQRPAVASQVALIAERQPLQLVQSFTAIKDRGLRRALIQLVDRIAQREAERE